MGQDSVEGLFTHLMELERANNLPGCSARCAAIVLAVLGLALSGKHCDLGGAARISAPGLDTLAHGESSDHQGGDRVSPRPPEQGVQ